MFDKRRPGIMVLRLELRHDVAGKTIKEEVIERFRNVYQFKPEIELVSPGTLPRSEMKSRRVLIIK